MKHLLYGDKALFVDDLTADTLLEYAGLLAMEQSGDTVTVRAIGRDGNEIDVTFVLNMATNMVAESTNSEIQPPQNDVAVTYMQERIERFRNPPPSRPVENSNAGDLEGR